MAQKITLSIPDMLHEKITEWRSSFNFSKLFQEALTDAIQKKEELQKKFSEDFELPDIVKRLKQEKQAFERKFFGSGRTEGAKWARSASYQDLLYVLNYSDTYELIGEDRFKAYFKKIYREYELAKFAAATVVDHERQFIIGWFQGVNEFWNAVKEDI